MVGGVWLVAVIVVVVVVVIVLAGLVVEVLNNHAEVFGVGPVVSVPRLD